MRNTFEVSQKLEQHGPTIVLNSDHEFSTIIARSYDEVHARLITENSLLKDSLTNLHKEINEMLAVRKEIFMRRRKIELGNDF